MDYRIKKVVAFCVVPQTAAALGAVRKISRLKCRTFKKTPLNPLIVQHRGRTLNQSIWLSRWARSAKFMWQWATSSSITNALWLFRFPESQPSPNGLVPIRKEAWGAVAFATCPESFTNTQPPKRPVSRCLGTQETKLEDKNTTTIQEINGNHRKTKRIWCGNRSRLNLLSGGWTKIYWNIKIVAASQPRFMNRVIYLNRLPGLITSTCQCKKPQVPDDFIETPYDNTKQLQGTIREQGKWRFKESLHRSIKSDRNSDKMWEESDAVLDTFDWHKATSSRLLSESGSHKWTWSKWVYMNHHHLADKIKMIKMCQECQSTV